MAPVRKVVGSFSHSWKKRRDLAEAQQALQSDCKTRWGSAQLMISRILEQKDSVLRADVKTRPSWQYVDVLESLLAALGPLDLSQIHCQVSEGALEAVIC